MTDGASRFRRRPPRLAHSHSFDATGFSSPFWVRNGLCGTCGEMKLGGRRFLLSLAIIGAAVCLALGISLPIIRLTKYVFWTTEHSLLSTVNVLIRDGQTFLEADCADARVDGSECFQAGWGRSRSSRAITSFLLHAERRSSTAPRCSSEPPSVAERLNSGTPIL